MPRTTLAFIAFTYLYFCSPAFGQVADYERQEHFSFINSGSINYRSEIKSRLFSQYGKWKGVKYKWGGKSLDGIDCSALVQIIYAEGFSKLLPRTTGEQIKNGKHVDIDELLPGDLIFFQTRKSVRHVGVYVGNSNFVHASGSLGVTVSSLDNKFWTSHFETARRILG